MGPVKKRDKNLLFTVHKNTVIRYKRNK